MSLFYAILGFAIGLGLGWYLWGRLRGELDDLRRNVDGIRSERDRLKGEKTRLTVDLEACGAARADLERKLGEAKAPPSAAALVSAPVAVDPPASPAPRKARKPAAAKPAKVRAAATGSVRAKAANSPAKDNLRRLIGIGPANARKLNEHGVTTFAQIAAWTAADVKRVEEYLEFDGRIKREKWVQQAKLLAAGKEKEFARRFPTAASSDNT